jgi:hypothetical protein
MTLEQVALRARVSAATVPRVLNNKAAVSSAARARVMKVVQELKFSPNLDPRGLAVGSRSVGVIVSNLGNPFFLDIYKAIEAGAGIAGFDITMANTGYSPERSTASVRLMIGRRVAGLAAIVSEMDPGLIEELNAYRIPTVFYDVGAPGNNIVNIRVELPARHGKANRLSPQPGASSRGVCGTSHDVGAHQRASDSSGGCGRALLRSTRGDRRGRGYSRRWAPRRWDGACRESGHHGGDLRKRPDGAGNFACASRQRTARPARYFRDGLRQHQAGSVQRPSTDVGPHLPRGGI